MPTKAPRKKTAAKKAREILRGIPLGHRDQAPWQRLVFGIQARRPLADLPQVRFGSNQKDLSRALAPIRAKFATNVQLADVLTKLRDTLLPKLISGKLRIEDTERISDPETEGISS